MFSSKIVQSILATGFVALFACNAQANLLSNGSFEAPDASGGDIFCSGADGWICANEVYTNNYTWQPGGDFSGPEAVSGNQTLKMWDPTGSTSFAYQSVAVTAGETYELSAWVMNWAGDPFNSLGLLGLTFWDGPNGSAGGSQLGAPFEVTVCAPGSNSCAVYPDSIELAPQIDGTDISQWLFLSVSGVAPAGSQSASAFLQISAVDNSPGVGSLYWDSVSLQQIPVPAAVWLFGSGLMGLLGLARRNR